MDQLLDSFDADAIGALPHQTPYFLISRDRVRRNLQAFCRAFPGAFVHYAMKANAEPQVLRTLNDAGSGFEAASRYELRQLLAIGVPPQRILYGTSVKPRSHIAEFARCGIDRFACDCLSELHAIASEAPARGCMFASPSTMPGASSSFPRNSEPMRKVQRRCFAMHAR